MSFLTGTWVITETLQLKKILKNQLTPPRGSPVKAGVRLRLYGCKQLKEEE